MTTEGKSIAAGYALDCIAKAEHATRGQPPNADQELAKAQVYAILAVTERLEALERAVGAVRSALLVNEP